MKILAIVLLAVGLIGLVTGGFSFTTKEKVVDLGPIDISRDKTHTTYIPVVGSVAALAAGAVILLAGNRRTS
jgi:amino acid transporter